MLRGWAGLQDGAAGGLKYRGHGLPLQLWTETGDSGVGVLGHGGIPEKRHSK